MTTLVGERRVNYNSYDIHYFVTIQYTLLRASRQIAEITTFLNKYYIKGEAYPKCQMLLVLLQTLYYNNRSISVK